MNVLVIDIGGTNVKIWGTPGECLAKVPSGKELTPEKMLDIVHQAALKIDYDRVTIGYPGKILDGKPEHDPWNLGPGWVDLDFSEHFHKPVRLINDAAMQALGSYQGKRMLYVGVGTSVGSALVADHIVVPLELGALGHPFGDTLEDHLSKKALKAGGERKWRKALLAALPGLRHAFGADYIVLGGGNAKRIQERLPEGVRLGDNSLAYNGGCRVWNCRSWGTLHAFDGRAAAFENGAAVHESPV